jgi:hypothetical protein
VTVRSSTLASLVAASLTALSACSPTATPPADGGDAVAPDNTLAAGGLAVLTAEAVAATAYPAPMQTEKSDQATEGAAYLAARETASAVGRDAPITAGTLVRYANPELGLSFAYPAALGEVAYEVTPGETGESWSLRFSRYDALTLAGVSPDYSAGRGGIDEDTYGYRLEPDGSVRWLTIPSRPDGEDVEGEEVIQSAAGVEVVLFLLPPAMGSPDGTPPGPLAALVNLAGERFPGLIVLNRDPARLPEDTLRAILATVELSEPIAP